MGKATAAPGATAGGRAKTAWHKTFLAELARTSNVAAAARKAKIDSSTAYKTRRANRRFARLWFEALCEGYDNLEMDLLHRLREGELEGGARARAKRKFDNATAFRLLAAHRAAVVRQRARREDEDESAVYVAIHAKLDAMRDRAQNLPELIARQPVKRLSPPDAQ